MNRYYVRAVINNRGRVIGYSICDRDQGVETTHATYKVEKGEEPDIALHLANTHRDDLNEGIE